MLFVLRSLRSVFLCLLFRQRRGEKSQDCQKDLTFERNHKLTDWRARNILRPKSAWLTDMCNRIVRPTEEEKTRDRSVWTNDRGVSGVDSVSIEKINKLPALFLRSSSSIKGSLLFADDFQISFKIRCPSSSACWWLGVRSFCWTWPGRRCTWLMMANCMESSIHRWDSSVAPCNFQFQRHSFNGIMVIFTS